MGHPLSVFKSRSGSKSAIGRFGMGVEGASFQTLYTFGGTATNGTTPLGKLVLEGATLYGTASGGGLYTNGMVFSLNATNGIEFTDLHDFNGTNDGKSLEAGLAVPVVDSLISIWSLDTTINVSAENVTNLSYSIAIDNYYLLYVNGTEVNWVNHNMGAQWSPYLTLTNLHQGENDIRVIIGGDDSDSEYFAMVVTSAVPVLYDVLGYGTTYYGGAGDGTVFAISPEGYEVPIYTFSGPDGQNPMGDLVLSSNTLYGVTYSGGTSAYNGFSGYGTIFSVCTNGSGFTNLHNFTYTPDGAYPVTGLILSSNTLYGTASTGGTNGNGMIFSINTDGSGYANLYSFTGGGDGLTPESPLVLVSNMLYGTASAGGVDRNGTIFSLNKDGSGFTTNYTFSGMSGGDSSTPEGRLAVSGNTLYGTTYFGGSDNNNGTIFSFTIGSTSDGMLYDFTNQVYDQNVVSVGGLTLSGNTLYGTTYWGGSNSLGTIFSIGTNGNNYNVLKTFGSFAGDGENPAADLIVLSNLLYGTTYYGGTNNNNGMIFSVKTNGNSFNDIYDFMGTPSDDGAYPYGGLCSP